MIYFCIWSVRCPTRQNVADFMMDPQLQATADAAIAVDGGIMRLKSTQNILAKWHSRTSPQCVINSFTTL